MKRCKESRIVSAIFSDLFISKQPALPDRYMRKEIMDT